MSTNLLTNIFAPGDAVTAEALMTNLEDLIDLISGLTVEDMSLVSGLLSTNLADRNANHRENIILAPYSNDPDWSAAAVATALPDSTGVLAYRIYMDGRQGKTFALVAASVSCIEVTAGTGPASYPVVKLYHNGNIIGGAAGAVIDTANTAFRLRTTTPYDSPMATLAPDDYIDVYVGRSATGGADPTWRGAVLSLSFKAELGG